MNCGISLVYLVKLARIDWKSRAFRIKRLTRKAKDVEEGKDGSAEYMSRGEIFLLLSCPRITLSR